MTFNLALFLACVLFPPCLITGDIMKLHFPYTSEKTKFPRVRIKAQFSLLSSFTLCQWVKPNFDGREMAVFSYGVPGQDEEISLSLTGNSIFWYVGGNILANSNCDGHRSVNWISGAWHHLCVVWTNTHSNVKVFVNGEFCLKSSSEYSNHRVPGSGVMVLGQALKGLDTDFHKNKSWNGDIAGVQMWDEVLTYQQIVDVGRCKGNKEGNVVEWLKTPMVASDEVVLSITNVCDILKKTEE